MEPLPVGFAICGSFCTHHKALAALERVKAEFGEVIPIVSETAAATDTRFGAAHELLREVERICDRRAVSTIREAEPLGPKKLLSALAIVPCTGNTLAKLACGVTDSCVTMAAKAHLRNGRPVVLALATNDGLAANAKNLGALLARRNVYFVPFRQDDPEEKPFSLMADFTQVPQTLRAALEGRQLQPVLLGTAPRQGS
ncbi:MAG: dipicolinate synthase subunit B [Oscillospiraceae bacterium]|nr:dipicolinate synthase subunit B [Oscillospiraceae bacterium]